MQFAFIDPATDQVMAVQRSPNPPQPTRWETTLGYTRIVVPDDIKFDRDSKLTHANGVATKTTRSVNPDQPVPSAREIRREEIQGKINDDSATLGEVREFLRSG